MNERLFTVVLTGLCGIVASIAFAVILLVNLDLHRQVKRETGRAIRVESALESPAFERKNLNLLDMLF